MSFVIGVAIGMTVIHIVQLWLYADLLDDIDEWLEQELGEENEYNK